MRHVSINVYGRVQGVGFRYTALQIATDMGIVGTVKNELDGSVSIEAEADERVLYIFLGRIKDFPSPFAKVNTIDYDFSDNLKSYKNFSVIG
ncbi:acylphosphatase [Companilactobacillus mishanensis]|uniref:acylphosphatase n=1 Tax=Companilactobacillus mishanensis TaxID=2486008 RepID=A0A5P0ZEH5_9LACO|nr:acylphosphatase [Companilactobacillus mishanensis]MQS44468.1 acylphosphatase [Companilactobacillus mishanensis]MQS51428.1 acylphosphatase [Companilactobacillus mishanensis]MQS88711.1 acylphosphatase [Companilactobacillus mishanensis]